MLICLIVLFCFQALGEYLSRYLPIPIPGPVIGMILLFISLVLWPALLRIIEKAAMDFLQHLSLLYIPAGAGIMVSAAQVGSHWLAILIAMLLSTVLTMAAVVIVFSYLEKKSQVLAGQNAQAGAQSEQNDA